MKRDEVLAGTGSEQAELIRMETERLQKQKDSDTLPDPELNGEFFVERQSPITPAKVAQSVQVKVRNAALTAVGSTDNLSDETNADANIAEAEAKTYEGTSSPAA